MYARPSINSGVKVPLLLSTTALLCTTLKNMAPGHRIGYGGMQLAELLMTLSCKLFTATH